MAVEDLLLFHIACTALPNWLPGRRVDTPVDPPELVHHDHAICSVKTSPTVIGSDQHRMLEQFFIAVVMEIKEGHAPARLPESPVPVGVTVATNKENHISFSSSPQLVRVVLALGIFVRLHGNQLWIFVSDNDGQ